MPCCISSSFRYREFVLPRLDCSFHSSTPSIFFSTCIGREGVWWSRKRDVLGLTALYNMMCLLYLIDWDGLSWAVADRPAVRWWKTPTPSCTSGIAIKATGWKTTASSSFFSIGIVFLPFLSLWQGSSNFLARTRLFMRSLYPALAINSLYLCFIAAGEVWLCYS